MNPVANLVDKYADEMAGIASGAESNPNPIGRGGLRVLFQNSLFRFENELDTLRRNNEVDLMHEIVWGGRKKR